MYRCKAWYGILLVLGGNDGQFWLDGGVWSKQVRTLSIV